MRSKMVRFLASILIGAALMLVSCGPQSGAPAQAPTTGQVPAVPAPGTPAPVPASPADKANMVSVSLRKVDGTAITKQVERPKYGGTIVARLNRDVFSWGIDPALMGPALQGMLPYAEQLIRGDWARGRAGTDETAWYWWEWPGVEFASGELAEKWEFPDDETIIFRLRKGAHFALDGREASRLVGGRELVADDVVFSLKRMYDNPIPAATLKDSKVREIYAADKYTVVVKLPRNGRGPFWVYAADLGTVYPPELITKYGDLKDWRNVVGTGAFMIKDFLEGSSSTWVKNPKYWDVDPVLGKNYPLPYVDTIKELVIPDKSTYWAALRTGRVDFNRWIEHEKPEDAEQLRRSAPHLQERIFEGGSMTRFALQLGNPQLPFKDIRVRRALVMAINYQEIVDTYFRGQASILSWPIANAKEFRDLGWHIPLKELPREIQELYEYNPGKAKTLLAEAGYPNGFKTSVVLDSLGPMNIDLAMIVKEYWAKIGVELTLDIKESAVFRNVQTARNYSGMIAADQWGTPGEYNWFGKGDVRNHSNVDDPKIDTLRAQIFDNYWDTQKRLPVMQELFKYTLSQAYYVNLPVAQQTAFWQPWLKGWYGEFTVGYWGVAPQYAFMWIDQDLKKRLGY